MSSRKLNFDDENKQFIALYTNIKGEIIEKRFKRRLGPYPVWTGPVRQTADKTHAEIIKYWRSVDALSIREKITKQAEYLAETKKRDKVA